MSEYAFIGAESWSNRLCNKLTRWEWFSLILPLLAVSPLLYVQAIMLWQKQHMQFFPLAFFAAVWFIRNEGTSNLAIPKWRSNAALVLSISGIACCYAALGLFSAWLAHLALITLTFAWCLGKFANLSVIRILGICGLMAVTLPPPNNGDQQLVQSLQSLSTSVSSRLMDETHILHVRAGNVVDIQSKSLFVEEACSGVDSQYALMAVAGTLLLVGRAGLVVSLITIVTVPMWAILGNLLRIYAIVIGIEYLGVDLSAGTLHTFLGLLTFSLAAWAHWSSVQFLNFASLRTSFRQQQTNNYSPEVYVASSSNKRVDLVTWPSLLFPGLLLFAMPLTAFVVVQSLEISPPKLSSEALALMPNEPDLPRYSNKAQRVSFHTETRARNDMLGQVSRAWQYSSDQAQQTASLDFPFRGWHPLWVCYEVTGWQTLHKNFITVATDGSELEWPYVELTLRHPTGEHALLLFCLFDERGKPFISEIARQDDAPQRFSRSLVPSAFRALVETRAPPPVTFQFQLLSRSSDEATFEQLQDCRTMFLEFRQTIREKSMPAFQALMGRH